jgi:hypothetical protein
MAGAGRHGADGGRRRAGIASLRALGGEETVDWTFTLLSVFSVISHRRRDGHGAGDEHPRTCSLGRFSFSLTVKDLKASRAFYEKLGFEAVR